MFFRKSCDECEGYKAEIDRLRTQLVKAETKIAQLSDALEAKAGHEDDLDNCQPTDRVQATKSDVAECIHQGDRRVLENSVTAEQNELDTRRTSAVAKSGMSNRQWLDHKVAEHQKRQAKKEQAYAQDEAENIRLACQNHAVTLIRNFRKCRVYNDYGALVEDTRHREAERFLDSVQLSTRYIGIDSAIIVIVSTVDQLEKAAKDSDFSVSNFPDNGHDFEHWTADALRKHGWKARVTQGSGDQGVDVIAEKNGVSLGIQCKRYSGSVGNKAIQEAYSGMKHFGLDKAAVLTNASFTKSAKELAATTGVLLLSIDDIPYLDKWPELSI